MVGGHIESGTAAWWVLTAAVHLPFAVICFFLLGGMVERVGYFWRGRAPEPPGRLPAALPSVCVQLPMYDEPAVAQRLIEAACAITWPADRLQVQVLDDSSDEDTRRLVAAVCARMRAERGIDCAVRHRQDRQGYKAGALEEGRRATDADFLAIFDADFVPTPDFLLRTVPHFYDADGRPDDGLALVQAQWGHLNHDESALTRAQSLWLDDHHTVQMSWRSATWRFVNFTGTAGIWRARAVEAAGGWRAASLVEDCELSFRHLFAGYRTRFVKEIVVPAELPATFTAYKSQQKRWTKGWVQLQRLHLGTLLFRYPCSWVRRLHLTYHMCIAWQWPAWAIWTLTFPFAISAGLWFGALGTTVGALVYFAPTLVWLVFVTVVATVETRHTYDDADPPAARRRRLARLFPYVVVNTGMLPHQFLAFAEGLFGPLHSEFERTPKAGSGDAPKAVQTVKIRWPYVAAEAVFVAYQLTWAVVFAVQGLALCAIGASFLAACVGYVAYHHYADNPAAALGLAMRLWWGGSWARPVLVCALAWGLWLAVVRPPGVVGLLLFGVACGAWLAWEQAQRWPAGVQLDSAERTRVAAAVTRGETPDDPRLGRAALQLARIWRRQADKSAPPPESEVLVLAVALVWALYEVVAGNALTAVFLAGCAIAWVAIVVRGMQVAPWTSDTAARAEAAAEAVVADGA